MLDMANEIDILKRKLEREKAARKQAENLLEQKALELYESNEKLKALNQELEKEVKDRTEILVRNYTRLSSLVNSLSGGILVEDEQRCIFLVNEHFLQLFDIQMPIATLIGSPISEHVEQVRHQFTHPEAVRFSTKKVTTRRKPRLNELFYLKDGRILERDYIPIFTTDAYAGHLWHFRDVTEKHRYQNELIAAKKDAEQARLTEQLFLAKMSHEIRTPLNAIIGMTYLLEDSDLSEKQTDNLNTLKYSANLLLQLITDILDLSKIESGNIVVKNRSFNLRQLIKKLKDSFQIQIDNTHTGFDIEYDETIPQWISGDDILLQQILFNLIGNAIKFTPQGQVTVRVKLLNQEDDKLKLRFQVQDTGKGIPKEALDSIFDKYQQASQEHADKGTGLGLSIVNELVKFLNGTIALQSELNEGTCVTFHLEYTKASTPTLQETTVKEVNVSETNQILVVEDNKNNIKYITNLLNQWKINYRIAETAKEAYKFVCSTKFDLILMDILLPDSNGFEIAKNIRGNGCSNANTPIIALTASSLSHHIQLAQESGMNDYVTKPFIPNDLKVILEMYLPSSTQNETCETDESFVFSNQLDQDRLSQLYNNNLAYASEMFEIFLEVIEPEMNNLQHLLEPYQAQALRKLIHKLKPSFGYVGLTNIEEIFDRLQHELDDSNRDKSEIIDKTQQVLIDIEELLPIIEQQFEQLQETQKSN
ncbi:response regulator [Puteibacter caeruleilacunae]|nr:response regulator [Puteibacter caeruleilacunae]